MNLKEGLYKFTRDYLYKVTSFVLIRNHDVAKKLLKVKVQESLCCEHKHDVWQKAMNKFVLEIEITINIK